MIAAETLNCQNCSSGKLCSGCIDRIAGCYAGGRRFLSYGLKCNLWPAGRAGIWLGMKASIERVAIFSQAGRAHQEGAHGCFVAVIGHIADDRKAWAAVGAVDKSIAVAPVIRVK